MWTSPPLRTQRILAALAFIALSVLAVSEITTSPAIKDASESLQMALNLERHGVLSMSAAAPFEPSMQREPIPIAVSAATIALTDHFLGRVEPEAYASGDRVRCLKLQNLLWLWLLAASSFTAARRFTGSFGAALLAALLAVAPFTWFMAASQKTYVGVDSLNTDLAGAALLSAASLLLAVSVQRQSRRAVFSAAAGTAFGLLALTKASVFYIYPALLLLVLWRQARAPRCDGASSISTVTAALLLPFILIVTPWMVRNYLDTGFLAIAERGGPVLLYRAYLDDMSGGEYLGSFSAWGNPYARKVAAKLTGYSPQDLEAGGRLERIAMQFSGDAQDREMSAEDAGEPQRTLSWYRRSRAEYNLRLAQHAAAGHRYPSGAADVDTRNEALMLILQRPFKHAAVMLPLLWRGVPVVFPLLAITFLFAWKRGVEPLAVYVLPSLLLIAFFAAATHFSERYGLLPVAESMVGLVALIAMARVRTGGSA